MTDKYTSSSYIKQSGLISKVSLVDKKGGKSKYVAINPQLLNFVVYSVDGGIINSVDTHKCDFAIKIVCNKKDSAMQKLSGNLNCKEPMKQAIKDYISWLKELNDIDALAFYNVNEAFKENEFK